jgi:hypothetical protein
VDPTKEDGVSFSRNFDFVYTGDWWKRHRHVSGCIAFLQNDPYQVRSTFLDFSEQKKIALLEFGNKNSIRNYETLQLKMKVSNVCNFCELYLTEL